MYFSFWKELKKLPVLFLLSFLFTSTSSLASSPTDPLAEYKSLLIQAAGLQPKVLQLALDTYQCAMPTHSQDKQILTIIDYSQPSTAKRFWVLDLKNKKVLFNTLVAHGKNSGGKLAHHFSNQPNSLATSLGVFKTGTIYQGQHGYSLQLHGMEKEFNDQADARHIVIHSAWYVSDCFAKMHGRLGSSWGCPALDEKVAKPIIDTIKNGSLVFAYYPDQKWLAKSQYLHCQAKSLRS